MTKARLVAFAPARDSSGAHAWPLPVTVRAFPSDFGSAKLRSLTMHWGAGVDKVGDWGRPGDDVLPPHSERVKDAVQTVLQPAQGGEAEAEGWQAARELVQEMTFQLPAHVQALNFVLKSGDKWYKSNGGNDFQIRTPVAGGQDSPAHKLQGYTDVGALSLKYQPIFEFEGRGGLALMERFETAKAFLEGLASDDPQGLAAVFVWLRFSQVRQLAWQRKHNTKPFELGLVIQDLSKTFAWKWKDSDGSRRELLRMLISTVPRGGGDGQAIRDYILVIMRKFEIKKRKGTFMEEWHQKLHNNSTPDDIYICEAYLEFLRTHGDLNAFYAHLFKHGIDRKRLQTYDRPILQEPHYFPSIRNGLSNELRKYLEILKSVHSGSDLRRLLNQCKHIIGDQAASNAAASLDYGGEVSRRLGALSRAVEARRSIGEQMVKEGDGSKLRDLLYLDLALESQSRLIIESSLPQVSGGQLALWLALAAESLLITLRFSSGAGGHSVGEKQDEEGAGCDVWRSLDSALKKQFEELREALGDLMELLKKYGADVGGWVRGGDKWGALWGAAVVERVQRSLGGLIDRQQSMLQAVAEEIGGGLRMSTPDKRPEGWSVTMFTEEVVRGGMGFAVSGLMRKLEAEIRAVGGLSAWQIVSPGAKTATGVLRSVVLKNVQEEEYQEPTVLLAQSITGEEEIPPGVVAILTPDAVDVLSHVSVRARQLKVLFASCFDPLALETASQLAGESITCSIAGDKVEVTKSGAGAAAPSASTTGGGGSGGGAVDLKVWEAQSSAYCIQEVELPAGKADMCGAKTNNLIHLRQLLAGTYNTPASAVVPFGTLVRTLGDGANAAVKARYEACVDAALKGDKERIGSTLIDIQQAIAALAEPKGMQEQVLAAMRTIEGANADWRGAFDTIKRVWASTWNERAFIACRKAAIDPQRIQMCVLVQKIVEAQYAFVLHTVNPTTSDPSEMYGEVVVGQGEALVGNAPGRAFGFACRKQPGAEPVVKSLPSKGTALWGKGWIFRSETLLILILLSVLVY